MVYCVNITSFKTYFYKFTLLLSIIDTARYNTIYRIPVV